MNPNENAKATEARINASRRLARRWRSSTGMHAHRGRPAGLPVRENEAHPTTRVAAAFNFGGVSKVCQGAGEGTSHSRPSAPSQGFCGAG